MLSFRLFYCVLKCNHPLVLAGDSLQDLQRSWVHTILHKTSQLSHTAHTCFWFSPNWVEKRKLNRQEGLLLNLTGVLCEQNWRGASYKLKDFLWHFLADSGWGGESERQWANVSFMSSLTCWHSSGKLCLSGWRVGSWEVTVSLSSLHCSLNYLRYLITCEC